MTSTFHVLVAEDEESDFELLELALSRSVAGVIIYWVRDGARAKSYLAGEHEYADRRRFPFPDLLITDLKLPHMSGLELIEWVKTNAAFRRLPIAVMTSSNQPVDVDQAYLLGANAYFLKPARFDDLVDVCRCIMTFWSRAIGPRMT